MTTGPLAAQENFLPDGSPPEKTGEVKYTLLKPGDKTVDHVKEGERNPYGKSDEVLREFEGKGSNEENEIRDRLARLRVVGVSPGARGLRVMLGDMVLEPGELVPQVLTEQTVALRVGTITPRSIELVWVEKKPSGLPPRVLTIPVDLRPYVRFILKGQANEKNQWEKESSGNARSPVGTQFPEVAQTAATNPSQLAQNDRSTGAAPANPATATPARADKPAGAAPGEEAPKKTDSTVPSIKPIPEWEEAMSLLQKLVPLSGGGDKK